MYYSGHNNDWIFLARGTGASDTHLVTVRLGCGFAEIVSTNLRATHYGHIHVISGICILKSFVLMVH